jgi:hypothetical protein
MADDAMTVDLDSALAVKVKVFAAAAGTNVDLVGWTDDRIVAERLARLPQAEWVFGRPNASVVMAAFLHVAPGGMRFNSADLGAWYAAAPLTTAAVEVARHLRREAVARGAATVTRTFRTDTSRLAGDCLDIRGQQSARPEVYASESYVASQALGEQLRAAGGAGVIFDSLRHAGGINVVAHRPRNVLDVTQTDRYGLTVQASAPRIELRRLVG